MYIRIKYYFIVGAICSETGRARCRLPAASPPSSSSPAAGGPACAWGVATPAEPDGHMAQSRGGPYRADSGWVCRAGYLAWVVQQDSRAPRKLCSGYRQFFAAWPTHSHSFWPGSCIWPPCPSGRHPGHWQSSGRPKWRGGPDPPPITRQIPLPPSRWYQPAWVLANSHLVININRFFVI